MNSLTRNILPSAALVIFGISSLQAGLTTYTDRATFQAAAGGSLTVESFESQTLGDNFTPLDVGPFTINDTGITSFGLPFQIRNSIGDANATHPTVGSPSKALFPVARVSSMITLTFDTPITAIGFDYSDAGDDSGDLVFKTNLGDSFKFVDTPPNIATGTIAFFGAISDTPVTSIDIEIQGAPDQTDVYGIDFVEFGTATGPPVPETSDIAWIGVCVIGILVYARRRLPAVVDEE